MLQQSIDSFGSRIFFSKGINTVSSLSGTPREAAAVEKWIVEARQGDREALGRLLELCRHYLLLVAGTELTPALWAKVAPSDIVQDTLMAAGRDYPRFAGGNEEELLAWLRGILRNNVADAHRQFQTEKRRASREVSLTEVPPSELPLDQTESPSRQAQTHEQDEQVEKAMQQLPPHYRQVLRMHTMDGLTFVQIAAKLGRSADSVRKLFGRAVEELAEHLDAPKEST